MSEDDVSEVRSIAFSNGETEMLIKHPTETDDDGRPVVIQVTSAREFVDFLRESTV